MKTSRLAVLALAAGLALPTLAHAQPAANTGITHTFQFGGVANPSAPGLNGIAVGPYRAGVTAPVAFAPFDIFCIDFDDVAQSVWNAKVVSFQQVISNATDLAAARKVLGTNPNWGAAELRTAAFLSGQFATAPTNQWSTIHGKIWSLFSLNTQLDPFRAGAAADVLTYGGITALDNYDMIIDANAYLPNYTGVLNQTFIIPDAGLGIKIVPEPSTYALMGAGLLVIGYIRRRRATVA